MRTLPARPPSNVRYPPALELEVDEVRARLPVEHHHRDHPERPDRGLEGQVPRSDPRELVALMDAMNADLVLPFVRSDTVLG